jgi:hypothetical protein
MNQPTHIDRDGKEKNEGDFGWAEITRPAWRKATRAGLTLVGITWILALALAIPTLLWIDATFHPRPGRNDRWIVVLSAWWMFIFTIGYVWLRRRGLSMTERRQANDPWKPPL